MAVDDVDLFPDEDLSDDGEGVDEGQEDRLARDKRDLRDVVDLETVGHVSNSKSVVLELVGDETDVVSALNEALSDLVAVGLDSSELRECKICADKDVVLLVSTACLFLHSILWASSTRFNEEIIFRSEVVKKVAVGPLGIDLGRGSL